LKIHKIRVIEDFDSSTARLLDLCTIFAPCKQSGGWPSLRTVNNILKTGETEGDFGTTVQWDPCEVSDSEYKEAVASLMEGKAFDFYDSDEERQDA
jgi:hypothetical protein